MLIIETSDFIVALDEALDVDWMTTDAHEEKMKAATDGIGEMLNRAAALEGVTVEYLSTAQTITFRRLVGEGVARALQFDFVNSRKILDRADEFASARNSDAARMWYLQASTIAALLVVAVTSCAWMARAWLSVNMGSAAPSIVLCCGAGAIGAELSILQRVGKSSLEPLAGPKLHHWQGAGRIVLGVGAALIAILALKLDVILPQLAHTENPLLAYALLCLVAGTSERLVPDMINKIETAVSTEPSSKALPKSE